MTNENQAQEDDILDYTEEVSVTLTRSDLDRLFDKLNIASLLPFSERLKKTMNDFLNSPFS